jgi:hypothetical protein
MNYREGDLVFARSIDEAEALVGPGLYVELVETPTVNGLLPFEVFETDGITVETSLTFAVCLMAIAAVVLTVDALLRRGAAANGSSAPRVSARTRISSSMGRRASSLGLGRSARLVPSPRSASKPLSRSKSTIRLRRRGSSGSGAA